jgi:hypothetical protein
MGGFFDLAKKKKKKKKKKPFFPRAGRRSKRNAPDNAAATTSTRENVKRTKGKKSDSQSTTVAQAAASTTTTTTTEPGSVVAIAANAIASVVAPSEATTDGVVPPLDVGRLGEVLVNAHPNLIVQVAELRRFSIDSKFESATGMMRDPLGDAFDVSLSDGISFVKCLLATLFNNPIRFGVLKQHDIVRIKHVSHRFDEMRIGGDRVVIVDELEVLQHHDPAVGLPLLFSVADGQFERRSSLADFAPLRQRDFSAFEDAPLVGAREYYHHAAR